MAHLCVIAAKMVRGVVRMGTDIYRNETYEDFRRMWHQNFEAKTNRVAPKRQLKSANPKLSGVIYQVVGE